MSTKKNKNKSLSEKIAESFIPKPLADPEIDSDNETAARIIDFDEPIEEFDNKFSDIRKRNTKVLSEYSDKYKGKISSRKELESESESDSEVLSDEHTDESNEDVSASEDDLKEYRKKLENVQIANKTYESSDDEGLNDEAEEESDISDDDVDEENDSDYDTTAEISEHEDDVAQSNIIQDTNQIAEVQKGLAVQNQLKLWEKLLEVRIHSQKMLIKANSLPLPERFNKISQQDENFSTLAKETKENVISLLDNMLELHHSLAGQYSETKTLLKTINRKRNKPSAESSQINSDEPSIKKFAITLKDDFENFLSYRDSVLHKWYDRTQILTPGAGHRNSNKSTADNFDVVKKIETVLLNRNDLIKKSQTIKGNYQLFGKTEIPSQNDEENLINDDENGIAKDDDEDIISSEIYDDTDFYHQQLRELIEFKSNTSANPTEMSKQFEELQKLRQKMKKKVDTRASKGRKIRYVVHNKLVNFMAPNPNSEWTEESKNELYRSLFGS